MPTSGLEPLTCSLRVIGHALQGIANTAYLEEFPFPGLLRVAPYCAPGGIRWYQDERQLQSDGRSDGTYSRTSEPQSADSRFYVLLHVAESA